MAPSSGVCGHLHSHVYSPPTHKTQTHNLKIIKYFFKGHEFEVSRLISRGKPERKRKIGQREEGAQKKRILFPPPWVWVTIGINRRGENGAWNRAGSNRALTLAWKLPLPASWNAYSWDFFLQARCEKPRLVCYYVWKTTPVGLCCVAFLENRDKYPSSPEERERETD